MVMELGAVANKKGKYLLEATVCGGVRLTPLKDKLRLWFACGHVKSIVYRPIIPHEKTTRELQVKTLAAHSASCHFLISSVS